MGTVIAFGSDECAVCGKMVSMNGLAQFQHRVKHVRDGSMVRRGDGSIRISLREAVRRADAEKARRKLDL